MLKFLLDFLKIFALFNQCFTYVYLVISVIHFTSYGPTIACPDKQESTMYRIAGMFDGGKVFAKFGESSVVHQTLTSQNLAILMAEIYQFAKLYFANFF